jgi:hypothetical protein
MIRRAFTLLWLLFPVGVLAFHFNYGADYIAHERATDHLKQIAALEQVPEDQRDWERIIKEYDSLERELAPYQPPVVIDQIRLAKAKARLEMLDIATAITDLTTLLQDCATKHGDDAPVTRSVREMLGKANYYATCVLQANNAAEAEWRPFAERSRQLFRYLAEHENAGALADYEHRVDKEFERASARLTGQ